MVGLGACRQLSILGVIAPASNSDLFRSLDDIEPEMMAEVTAEGRDPALCTRSRRAT
jgi:hypothetical protein